MASEFITQTELAEKLGISLQHLNYYIKIKAVKTQKQYGKLLVLANTKLDVRKNTK
jgi:transcriptional regulator with XRE-family HTH domain